MAERLGAALRDGGRCHFLVWAPQRACVEVVIEGTDARAVPMARDENGYFRADVGDVQAGARYRYRLDGDALRPDPASRAQPEGVHGPSAVVPRDFAWTDGGWRGLPLHRYVLYELHVGAFTPAGTFDAVIPHLDTLAALGVTAVEIMPVAEFPGARNWGYDGVNLFAAHHTYGGAAGLKRLVDACHARGLAAVLDCVYNHFGPEGNYLWDFGPYFTAGYQTPWGAAVNFDGPHSDDVRRFFIENALQWLDEFHMDTLRLDAIDQIKDFSAYPFLRELADAVHDRAAALGRPLHLIAESDMNDARVIRRDRPYEYAMDAQWSDGFHHALHVALTGERGGYYRDFTGLADLATAYRRPYVYAGEYSAHRQRRHGNDAGTTDGARFVVCAQNHDQVGNRATGDRLSATLSFAQLQLAAGATLLAPYVPLLFMGEEYGETAPFQFFTSHGDEALIEAVRRGRREEFAAFAWEGEVPDPHDEATFLRSKLTHRERAAGAHRSLWEFYRALLRLRREHPALAHLDLAALCADVDEAARTLTLHRWHGDHHALACFNYGDEPRAASFNGRGQRGRADAWRVLLDSADPRWRGPGGTPSAGRAAAPAITVPPFSFVLIGTPIESSETA